MWRVAFLCLLFIDHRPHDASIKMYFHCCFCFLFVLSMPGSVMWCEVLSFCGFCFCFLFVCVCVLLFFCFCFGGGCFFWGGCCLFVLAAIHSSLDIAAFEGLLFVHNCCCCSICLRKHDVNSSCAGFFWGGHWQQSRSFCCCGEFAFVHNCHWGCSCQY